MSEAQTLLGDALQVLKSDSRFELLASGRGNFKRVLVAETLPSTNTPLIAVSHLTSEIRRTSFATSARPLQSSASWYSYIPRYQF